MSARMRRVLSLFGAVLLLGGGAFALRTPAVAVEVASVAEGPMRVTLEASARTRLARRYSVTAPVSGRVGRSRWQAGDRLERGAVLAEISPPSAPLLDARARAELVANVGVAQARAAEASSLLQKAELSRSFALEQLGRTRSLAEAGSLSPEALTSAQFEARLREQEVEVARLAQNTATRAVAQARSAVHPAGHEPRPVDRVTVRAPVSGRVLRVLQETEADVERGTGLLELGEDGSLEIRASMLTTDAVGLEPGAKAEVFGWGGEQQLPAVVERVEPGAVTKISSLGVEEQRVDVVLKPSGVDPVWQRLGDGFHLEVRIVTWQNGRVLQVPSGALIRQGASFASYVLNGNRAELRTVKLGHRNPSQAEVLGGLSPTERVIIYPGESVRAGVRVRPQPSSGQ